MGEDLMTKANDIKRLAYQMQDMVNGVESSGGPVPPSENVPEFEQIPSLFRPFTHLPNYQALESTKNRMHQEIAMLLNNDYGAPQGYTGVPVYQNPALSDIKTISGQMEHWLGQAAQNFQQNYVNRFDDFTQNLFVATFVAAEALGAEAAMWRKAHDDIHSIADTTKHALESMPGKSGATGIDLLITSLPSVVSIGEAAAKGAKDLALTAIKELPGKGKEVSAASGSFKLPRYLIYDMAQAIGKLKTGLQGMEQAIGNALNSNTGYIGKHQTLFVAPTVDQGAWDLVGAEDRHDSGKQDLGEDDRG